MKTRYFPALLTALCGWLLLSVPGNAQISESGKARIDSTALNEGRSVLVNDRLNLVLDSSRSSLDIVGLSAAIAWSDGRIWTAVSGRSTSEQLIRNNMLFGIGSATKTYVAALILKYVEKGLLKLDDSVANWLTDPPVDLPNITIRQLLNHTSGLYNYMAHPDYNAALYAYPDTVWSAPTLLGSFMQAPYAGPGESWHYSAANYLILGMLVEKLTGNAVHDEIQRELLQPLDLCDTYLYPQQLYDASRMAHLWMVLDSNGVPMDVNTLVGHPPHRGMFSSVWTAGAINATALDAATWLTGLFAGRLLTETSLHEMIRPVSLSGTAKYGLGIMTEEIDGVQAIGHSGGIGYSSEILYFPSDSLSIVVLCNCEADPTPIVAALYKEIERKADFN